jgi:hypothetical protein
VDFLPFLMCFAFLADADRSEIDFPERVNKQNLEVSIKMHKSRVKSDAANDFSWFPSPVFVGGGKNFIETQFGGLNAALISLQFILSQPRHIKIILKYRFPSLFALCKCSAISRLSATSGKN